MKTSQLFAVSVLTFMALGTLSTNARATVACYLATGGCGTDGTDGVQGTTDNNSGSGVRGVTGSTSGFAGVEGLSTQGYGVYGSSSAQAIYGYSTGNDGVYGTTPASGHAGLSGVNTATSGNAIGVYGESKNASGGYGVWAVGNVNTTGQYRQNGTCVAGCSSDERLKKNIGPVKDALNTLLQLKGVTFEYRNPEDQGKNATGTQTGFIAQAVEKVFPQWVGEDGKGFKTLTIQPNQLAALEIESIRSLKADNDELRARVKALESARRPVVSMNANGVGVGIAGIALAGALIVGRRKQSQERP